jgi:hypothetical protein
MKGAVVLVAVTLAAAIMLTAVLLLASSARGIDTPCVRQRPSAFSDCSTEHRAVDNFWRHRGVTNPL